MYVRNWEARSPGCMIFLLDQSGSMADPFRGGQAGGGKRKCDMLATIFNGFMSELITTNTKVSDGGVAEVRARADISVIGYEGTTTSSALGGSLKGKMFVSLPELQMNPVDIQIRKKKEVDDVGSIVEIDVPFPIWVTAKHGGGTPMCAALRRSLELAEQWARTHQNSYPPVIINVTDGMSTDGDPLPIAQQLMQVATSDGTALLFNVHLTDLNEPPVMYPASEAELPNDKYARLLFNMSSVIPESSRALLESLLGRPVAPGARGMIFNGDAASIRLMFNFASTPATQPLDPNR